VNGELKELGPVPEFVDMCDRFFDKTGKKKVFSAF